MQSIASVIWPETKVMLLFPLPVTSPEEISTPAWYSRMVRLNIDSENCLK
jgi:hypothetical protein